MGKKSGHIGLVSTPTPKEQRNRSVASYSPQNTRPKASGHNELPVDKMATEQSEMEGIGGAATKADIQQLEEAIIAKLSDKLAALIKPLQGQKIIFDYL